MSRSFRLSVSRPAGYLSLALGLMLAFLSAVVNASDTANPGLLPDWQEPRVVKNIAISTGNAYISRTVQMGDHLYFISTPGLIRSDGTPEGTILLESLDEIPTERLIPLGDKLVMIPGVGYPSQLWVTDGTPGNAHPILDDDLVDSISEFGQVTVAGPYLYFRTTGGGVSGTQLWRTDGTTTGTMRLTGSDRPLNIANPMLLAGLDGALTFVATLDGTTTIALMRSDGTPEGTAVVKSLITSSGVNAMHLGVLDGRLYFSMFDYDGPSNGAIWRSDGTAAGTSQYMPLAEGQDVLSYDDHVAVGDSSIYLVIAHWDGYYYDEYALWRLRADAAPKKIATPEGIGYPLVVVGDRAFFPAGNPVTGMELWTSDGSDAGTRMVVDLYPAYNDGYRGGLMAVGDRVYFAGSAGTDTEGLWRSDGTAAGTVEVPLDMGEGFGGSPEPLYDYDGRLFFLATDAAHGREPWITNLAGTGATLVKDTNDADEASSMPRGLRYANGRLCFVTDAGLWASNGEESGTTLVYENHLTMPGQNYVMGESDMFQTTAGLLYFHVTNYGSGQIGETELWRSDGTPGGTLRVLGGTTLENREAMSMADVNGLLYFTLYNYRDRKDLWRSDGTPGGTYRVATPNPDMEQPSEINHITGVGNIAYFVANDGVHGLELWRSDGTTAGTRLVHDIVPGAAGSNPAQLTAYNGRLYFVVDDGVHGPELWRSDGTAGGTVMVKDIKSGAAGSEPGELTVFNGRLYFSAADGVHGRELWRSDGTAAGTTLVKDIYPGGGSSPTELTPGRDWLYFVAFDEGGYQPWRSDGTAAGTSRIAVLEFNAFDWPHDLAAVGNTLFFSTVHHTEEKFYRSDGTAAGTIAFNDAFPDFMAYDYAQLTAAPGRLFFAATSLTHGNEPFVHIVDLTRRSPGTLYLPDGGAFRYYQLALNFRPTAPVTITFSSDDPTVEFSPPSLTIAPDKWDEPVSIGVRAADDGIEGNIREATITETFASADEQLDGAVTTMPISIGWRFAYAPMVGR